MTEVFEVKDWKGVMVKVGLGTPTPRAMVAAALIGSVAFLAKCPGCCFREDGSMKPCKALSAEPDATNKHFLLVPVTAPAIEYLFT